MPDVFTVCLTMMMTPNEQAIILKGHVTFDGVKLNEKMLLSLSYGE